MLDRLPRPLACSRAFGDRQCVRPSADGYDTGVYSVCCGNDNRRGPSVDGEQFAADIIYDFELTFRRKGWQLICEKGGLRRVLMNLIGNSLKFTSVSELSYEAMITISILLIVLRADSCILF